jgi:DnaJ domain
VADDPLAVFGLAPGATETELRAARRRMAMALHPDRAGGSAAATEAMRRLNEAFDRALAQLASESGSADAPVPGAAPQPPMPDAAPPVPRPGGRLAHDVASFTIEALPAEAFEALLVVTTWIGEVLVDDPPYQLDVVLEEPYACWCRLDLLPDAGATTVSLTVAGTPLTAPPDIDDVRDLWVANLNQLGRPD